MQANGSGESDVRRRWRLLLSSLARRGAGDLRDNLFGSRFAHEAIAVVYAALRQSEVASAGAALGVKFVESGQLLRRSQRGKVNAGKLAGTISMREEDLTGI